jgi:transposase
MTNMTQDPSVRVTIGVDTHRDVHVAVALDHLGRRLGELAVPTNRAGYADLLSWAEAQGDIEAFGIEGTGSYGSGLSRWLRDRDFAVIEVSRPNRQARRRRGKSDPADAEAAARAVLSGEASGTPKSADDKVEMIRMFRVARSGAHKARTAAINALRGLVVTAPVELAEELKGLSVDDLVGRATRFRPGPLVSTTAGAKAAMASLARRIKALDDEIAALTQALEPLVAEACPALVALYGVGTDSAGALLVSAGDNSGRLSSERAAAKLWGVAPMEASSGMVTRHRLNRGGDRQANAALYRIVFVRMRHHQATRDYVERRIKEGKSKREIMRCLKRYVVREVFAALTATEERSPELVA